MSHKKNVLFIALMVAAMSIFLTGCSNKANIGYVDLNRVIAESPQLKTINDNFEKEYKPYTVQMEDIAQKKGTMSDDDYKKAVQDLQRKVNGVQQKYTAQRKALMDKALGEISKEKSLSAVTAKSDVDVNPEAPEEAAVNTDGTVVQGGIDITDEVIKKLQ